jgi:cell fate (sporulation/competence/biofilm development) regulator YmcA (YheA/YmcA/DUF963 family)
MFWMFVILGGGVAMFFGGEKIHRKMLVSKETRARKQLQEMTIYIEHETAMEKMKPTEAEIREAEQDVERFLDPDWIE